MNPDMATVHHEEADGPTECITVMAQDFKSLMWETWQRAELWQWLLAVDQHSAYEHHKLVLQILQSQGVRGRWTLKSPHHSTALEPSATSIPDATFVQLHRDPVVVAASSCSFIRTLSKPFTDVDQREYIARHWSGDVLAACLERPEDFRARHPESPVRRCALRPADDGPDRAVKTIYAGADLELTRRRPPR